MLSHLKRMWRGEEKLWKVFWLWGVVGNGIWVLIYKYYLKYLITNILEPIYWDAPVGFVDAKANAISFILMEVLYLLYPIYTIIIVWKNIPNWIFRSQTNWLRAILLLLVTVTSLFGISFTALGVISILSH